LSVVIAVFKRLADAGGELRLVVAGERLRTLFTITKLSSVLPVFDTVAQAQAAPAHRGN
jgi:anti-anti-sigma regulatory factor